MLTTAGLGLVFGYDLVSGWLVVMHTYLCYFQSSLSLITGRKAIALTAVSLSHTVV